MNKIYYLLLFCLFQVTLIGQITVRTNIIHPSEYFDYIYNWDGTSVNMYGDSPILVEADRYPRVAGSGTTFSGGKSGDTYAYRLSAVIDWDSDSALDAIISNQFETYLASLTPGELDKHADFGGLPLGLGVDNGASTGENRGDRVGGLGEAIILTFDSSGTYQPMPDTGNIRRLKFAPDESDAFVNNGLVPNTSVVISDLHLEPSNVAANNRYRRVDYFVYDVSEQALLDNVGDSPGLGLAVPLQSTSGTIEGSWTLDDGDMIILAYREPREEDADVVDLGRYAWGLWSLKMDMVNKEEPDPPYNPPLEPIWHENFDFADGTDSDEGATPWSTTIAGGSFDVQRNILTYEASRNAGVFRTGPIELSGQPVELSTHIWASNEQDLGQDYLRIYVQIDGGPELLIQEIDGGMPSVQRISHQVEDADTVELIIHAYATSTNEQYFIYDITVTPIGSVDDPTDPDPTDLYGDWASSHGLEGADAEYAANPDSDNWNNFEEYAFGGDPLDPSDSSSIGPVFQIMGGAGDRFFEYIYRRRILGLSYTIVGTTDIASNLWTPVSITEEIVESTGNGIESVVQRIGLNGDEPKQFFRLLIEEEPTSPGDSALSWVEDFNHIDGTTEDNDGTPWSCTIDQPNGFRGYLEVRNGLLEYNSRNASNTGILRTGEIDISGGGSVEIELVVSANENVETNDEVRLFGIVDGGSRSLLERFIFPDGDGPDAEAAYTISSRVTGEALELIIEFTSNGDSEFVFLHRLSVTRN